MTYMNATQQANYDKVTSLFTELPTGSAAWLRWMSSRENMLDSVNCDWVTETSIEDLQYMADSAAEEG